MTFNPMLAMLNAAIQKNPQLAQYWDMAQRMSQGKSPEQLQATARNLAQQRGIDLEQVNKMMQNFISGNMNMF